MSDATTRWAYLRQLLLVLLVVSSLFVVPVAAQEDSDDSDDSAADGSIVCDVGIFKSLMNVVIPTILAGFSPIAVTALIGERFVTALPFLSQSRRKKFMEWRGKVLGAGAAMYIGLPVGVSIANSAGFPLPSCITFVPF